MWFCLTPLKNRVLIGPGATLLILILWFPRGSANTSVRLITHILLKEYGPKNYKKRKNRGLMTTKIMMHDIQHPNNSTLSPLAICSSLSLLSASASILDFKI